PRDALDGARRQADEQVAGEALEILAAALPGDLPALRHAVDRDDLRVEPKAVAELAGQRLRQRAKAVAEADAALLVRGSLGFAALLVAQRASDDRAAVALEAAHERKRVFENQLLGIARV